jgi:hypothetical protein
VVGYPNAEDALAEIASEEAEAAAINPADIALQAGLGESLMET